MKTSLRSSIFLAKCFFISLLVILVLALQSCSGLKTIPVDALTETSRASQTPFSSASQTPTLSKTVHPTETLVFDNKDRTSTRIPNGTIYVYEAGYGYIPVYLEDGFADVVNWYSSNIIGGDETYIKNLAFSPYSNQVAYLLNKTNSTLSELWVSNVDLSNARSVWTDSNNLLGYPPQDNDKQVITIRWGPGEKFVIVTIDDFAKEPKAQKNIVIDIQSKSFWETADYCDGYDVSSKIPGKISLFCKLLSDGYLALESDGTSRKIDTLPMAQKLVMQEWSIAPDGDGILYATKQGDIFIHSQGSISQLSMQLGELISFDVEMQPLQWSRDGSRLLIWGSKTGCSDNRDSCWQVIDTRTKKLLWTDTKTSGSGLATLSPDGKQVLRFQGGTALARGGNIIDIATNSSVFFIDSVFEKIIWVK